MSLKQWGPDLWNLIHIVGKQFPKKPTIYQKNLAYQFTKYLALVIPCKSCQKHYISNFAHNKPDLTSGLEFFKWTVTMHNFVNKKYKKKIYNVKQAYHSSNPISSKKLTSLLGYLYKETNNGNVSKPMLLKFIKVTNILMKNAEKNPEWGIYRDITTTKGNH